MTRSELLLNLTPLSTLQTEKHLIPPHPPSNLPNSAATNKPLLFYRQAFTFTSPTNNNNNNPSKASTAEAIEHHLRKTNIVAPQWRYGMYPTSHFHSTTHEVLCVSSGRARLLFGGEENPGRVEVVVQTGDVIVIPAGVAHRLLREEEGEEGGGFEMVGSYPVGAEQWDMCYPGEGGEEEEERVGRIKALEWFGRDPVYGETGPVLEVTRTKLSVQQCVITTTSSSSSSTSRSGRGSGSRSVLSPGSGTHAATAILTIPVVIAAVLALADGGGGSDEENGPKEEEEVEEVEEEEEVERLTDRDRWSPTALGRRNVFRKEVERQARLG
ncbi:uncharacterized protein B0T15DRAFT_504900 [Chaetomium strumarium]|uniref:Cupin type-1 domain-containing protein n=1 Tax=Chaetomium strumarium TaxID=1170767 RepID=A0AAJ0GPG8_9PEZI|nr:hypothetical protein B0T15DRAFT_504900 [Chaetomium strumarium]